MLEEKASSPMLLLQAVSPDGREITFLPSQHNIPLKEISSEAERRYLHGHHCLVRESITYTEVLSDGENLIKTQVDLVTDETVHNNEGIIVKKVRSIPYKLEYFLDESTLKIHQAFREEKDESWSFSKRNHAAELISQLNLPFQYTDLKKAWACFLIFLHFVENDIAGFAKGMDFNLLNHFMSLHAHEIRENKRNLKVVGLESFPEIFASFRLNARPLKNLNEGQAGELIPLLPYCSSLERLRDEERPLKRSNDFIDTNSIAFRNLNWIPRLKVLPSNTLVCVGAAHYTGPHGIIHLLAQEDFTWSQVTVHDDLSVLKTPLTQGQYIHPDNKGLATS